MLTANRRFPIVECNYSTVGLDEFNPCCAATPQPNFGKISRDYFAAEAQRNFIIEAIAFVALAATAIPAVIDCGRALVTFLRSVGAA